MADLSKIQTPDGTEYNIKDAVARQGIIPFINGAGAAGKWTGSLDGLTEYYDGLLILFKSAYAGKSTTTLNINNLGAKTIYLFNATKLTTHFSAGQPIMLVYSTSLNSGCWICIDNYDSGNTNTKVRVFRALSGYDDDHPILVSHTKTIGTAGTDASYSDVYGIIGDDSTKTPTINPESGVLKAPGFYDSSNSMYASDTVLVEKIPSEAPPAYDHYKPILFDSSDASSATGSRKVNAHDDLNYNPFVGSFMAPYFYGQQYAWQENYTDNGYECKRIYLWAARMGSGDSTLNDRKEVRFVHQIMYSVPITLTSTWGNSYYRSNVFKIKVPICEDIIGMTVSAQSNNKFIIANLSGVNASTGEAAIWFWGPKEEATAFNVHIHLNYACRYSTVYGVT